MTKPLLSVIIPAYNEKEFILKIIEKSFSAHTPGVDKEIIVVDDKSTDGTTGILKKAVKNGKFKLILHEKNKGKGGAVKTGFKAAKGDIILIQDADLEYDPKDYASVIDPILKGKTEMVLGARIQPKRDERKKKSLYWLSWIGNKLITWTTNILYLNNAEEYEGCYKAFTKDLIRNIRIETNDFDFDNELVCKALKKGYKSVDVPIHYYPRSYKEGKKINAKHGFKILWTIIKWRFKN